MAALGTDWEGVYAVQTAKITELEAEIERLRADAERYRWLRDNAGAEMTAPDLPPMIYMQGKPGTYSEPVGKELDAAIDAARRDGK